MWPNSVRKSDLKIVAHRSGGPGGQHRNRRSTAIRITHIPTGITAVCADHKSQHQNKMDAFRRLAEKLVPLMKGESATHRAPDTIVRTYHEPDQRVTDKRIPGCQWSYKDVVDGGDIGDIIDALIKIQ